MSAQAKPGDAVFIFETVTGNEFGEPATFVRWEGERGIVRAQDGALFSGFADQIEVREVVKEREAVPV